MPDLELRGAARAWTEGQEPAVDSGGGAMQNRPEFNTHRVSTNWTPAVQGCDLGGASCSRGSPTLPFRSSLPCCTFRCPSSPRCSGLPTSCPECLSFLLPPSLGPPQTAHCLPLLCSRGERKEHGGGGRGEPGRWSVHPAPHCRAV